MADDIVAIEDDKTALAEFTSGFSTELPSPAQPANGEGAKPEGATPPEDPKADAAPAAPIPAETPAPAPEYVQITKQDFETLQASAAKTPELEKRIESLFGKTGNIQQIINRLQEATPKGDAIELPEDVVSEMEAEYPDIAALLRKSLEKTIKGMRGTGSAEPGASVDQEAVKGLVQDLANKREMEALEDAHPDWRVLVGTVDGEGKHDENQPFRKWLAEQPAEYQTKINSTFSSSVITRAIEKFKASQAPAPAAVPQPSPKDQSRRDTIRDALPAKSAGEQPTPSKTPDDDFKAGFKSG